MLLREVQGPDLARLHTLIDTLLAQHRELEQAWSQVRWKLEGIWLGMKPELALAEVERMVELYRAHIAIEEEQLLPLAARLLGDTQLDVVGRAMRLRRGIKEI